VPARPDGRRAAAGRWAGGPRHPRRLPRPAVLQRLHDSTTNCTDLWRIVLPQRAGWFPQITIGPDLLTAGVDGEALDGAVLELSRAAGNQLHSVDSAGTYRFPLPHGLAHDSLLVLRRGDQWMDWRSFPAPTYGRARDASVVWEQPGPELDLLLANGEGQHLECKREVPEGESRRKMLKTIAAFASQDGGTVLIGVRDDLQIVGLPEESNVDKQVLQVMGMIRDNLEPVPSYEPRVIDHDGKKVLAIEVSGGGQMYAYRNGVRPEFYVRMGPNTVPARLQAGALLGESPAGPKLRAGLYRALARLHGVKLVGTVKDSAGRTGTELVFSGVASTDHMVIDPKTSALLETSSVSIKGSDRGQTMRVTYLSVGPADKIG
jgi:hypothetical protein